MHARELVELAAIVSAQGPVLIHGGGTICVSGVEKYWTASKCRLDRWARGLKDLSAEAVEATPEWRRDRWPVFRALLEEIITGEVLTRVFAAVMSAHDRQRGVDDTVPLTRGIMIGHLEARMRVLRYIVRGPGIRAEEAMKLNQLRRRTERWIDLLVGYLADEVEVWQFAIDPDRATDFAEDLSHQNRLTGGRHAWPLLQASLHAAFGQGLCPVSPNADLNDEIGTSVLSCFPSEVFDSTGPMRSLWTIRLANGADDAQGLIDDLLASEPAPASPEELHAADNMIERLRRFGRC
jgi:hypothetical protein